MAGGIAEVIATALLGAFWRRWLGLGGSGPRWLKFALALPLTWPLFVVMPLGFAIEHAALALLFFAPGHTVDDESVWMRYGPFAVAYVLARKFWPDNWTYGRWVDGWMAVGEFGIGFLFFGSLALTALI